MVPRAPRSTGEIVADLSVLGVGEGDLVMVHASLRAIGPVAHGPDGVIDALDAVFRASGTWLMVLGALDDWSWVNDKPDSQRADDSNGMGDRPVVTTTNRAS